MSIYSAYGLFIAKTVTLVGALCLLTVFILLIVKKYKEDDEPEITLDYLNDKYRQLTRRLQKQVLTKKEYKALCKTDKKAAKDDQKPCTYWVDFKGDMKASDNHAFRAIISALIGMVKPNDDVVVTLTSGGGMVSEYGLAASQLARLREKNIPLTVCIDTIAASGGYMMAACANKILAAPFAIIGSIGVLAQLPNFNRLLREHHVDFEQITAGKYKRTLSLFGENTQEGRQKFQEEIEAIHENFKRHLQNFRPQLAIESVATGEYWLATDAFEKKLIDGITTSDDYLLSCSENRRIYQVKYPHKRSLSERLFSANLRQKLFGWQSRLGW